MDQTVYQKSCCRNSSLYDLLYSSSIRCAMCWIPMLLSSATPCKLWMFGIVWTPKPRASIYSESLERGIYLERFPESALHGSAVCHNLCCHRGESGFWKSYGRKRIEDWSFFFSKWRIQHAEICTHRYILRVAMALGHFMKMRLAHRLVGRISDSGEAT